MDPEQTFLRVHARLSGMLARLLTPKFRTGLECVCLLNAVMLLALLVIMHVNFVGQPGCAEHFSSKDIAGAQLVQIKITGSWNRLTEDALGRGMWKQDIVRQSHINDEYNGQEPKVEGSYQVPDVDDEGWSILGAKFWLNLLGTNARRSKVARSPEKREIVREGFVSVDGTGLENGLKPGGKLSLNEENFEHDISTRPLSGPGRGPLGTALLHYFTRWSSYGASCFKRAEQSIWSFWQVWRITGWEPFTTTPKLDRRTVTWNKLDSVLVDVPETGVRLSDPTYLYSIEKGYLMMSEGAKLRHDVKTINISISAQHTCFGNRWQQLLIDNFVGYDTILMNSLLNACGRGYLYNFQTKELYNLNYLQDFGGASHGVEDYLVFKCGVLITSLFVFFTTTMSVSFTLRETQARMLKFTVQLQHHARHRLPTYRLIFIHVIESLVFVPIMIGILFFLFEFFDDQLLAFMVLTLVWLCELFTMISVRTPLSMQFFPRFFFLYFMVFHIYFFSYTYGFSYLAFSATAAFMQHLVMYFWNRFEVPALQIYLRRQAMLQQQGVHITSSAILTSVRVSQGNPPNSSTQTIRGLAGLNNLRSAMQTARNPRTPPESDADRTNNISTLTNNNSINPNLVPPGFRSWINNPMHEIDNNSLWRLEQNRVQREQEQERERERDQDADPLFREHGLDQSGDTQTATHGSPFTPYESVLPWILRGSSFLLPVFHHLGDVRLPSRDTNNDEHGDPIVDTSMTSTTLESGISQSLEGEGLRHRQVAHSVGEA